MGELSWKPRKYTFEGVERYCAPACGAQCTRQRYDRADRLAIHMAVALGSGWRKRLTENLGWYASARHPSGVEVNASVSLIGVTYSAFYRNWHKTGSRTPRAALCALLRAVRRDVSRDMGTLAKFLDVT